MTTTGPEPPASDATATRAALHAPSDNPVPAAADEAIAIAVERAAGPLLPWERIAAALRRGMLSGALPPGWTPEASRPGSATSGWYGTHDLVRRYARDLAAADPADTRLQALERLLDYYQHTAAGGSPEQSHTTLAASRHVVTDIGRPDPFSPPSRHRDRRLVSAGHSAARTAWSRAAGCADDCITGSSGRPGSADESGRERDGITRPRNGQRRPLAHLPEGTTMTSPLSAPATGRPPRRARRRLIALGATVAATVGLAGLAAPAALAGVDGGVDMNAACFNQYGPRWPAVAGANVYDWVCLDLNGGYPYLREQGINVTEQCVAQYGQRAVAQFSDYGDPYTWYCYTP